MLIQEMEVSETKVNHGMALICISAALASPCVAFSNLSILLGISVMAFSAFVTLQIFGPAWHLLVVQGLSHTIGFKKGQKSCFGCRGEDLHSVSENFKKILGQKSISRGICFLRHFPFSEINVCEND